VGQTYLDLAAAHGCRAPRHLCHHGIDLAPAIQRPEFRRENGLRLAYIGFMGASYDLETVLGGVAGLVREGKPVSLDLAGCGPKEVALRRFIAGQPCGVRERLRFHGYLGADELRRLLGESDLGLIPMKPESWVAIPNKAGDYAEAGLAMINGLTGETAALLAQWQAGTSYRVGDPASFSAAIMGYLDNPSRVRQEGANARRLAEERFDRQRIYPAFVRFLEETAAANLPTAGHR
jgi:glycosyltransferase involved in cell wall biosynthesis